ncbi:hypothetical protein HED49_03105 [Ochrobactrum daejeonense]|nr:hypothetical protein [Brucella daejeonensis]
MDKAVSGHERLLVRGSNRGKLFGQAPEKLGTVNFNTMTGTQLLDAFEAILAGSAKKPKRHAKKSLSPRPKYQKQQANQPKAA